jgi:hypothetical protein
MSSLYFGLDLFCQFAARVPEFDVVFSVECTRTVYSPQLAGDRGCVSNSGNLASNRQKISSPKYNDDISLLISQYLISATDPRGSGPKKLAAYMYIYHYN